MIKVTYADLPKTTRYDRARKVVKTFCVFGGRQGKYVSGCAPERGRSSRKYIEISR